MTRSKCRTQPPQNYWAENLTPGNEHAEAKALCAGCPVELECGMDVLERIDVGEFVDGLWVRQARQAAANGVGGFGVLRSVVGSGVDVVPHSGVVRAGVIMEWDGEE